MKKLSLVFFEALQVELRSAGIRGFCHFGVQGQVLPPSRRARGLPTAGELRFGLQESIEAGGVFVQHAGAGLHWIFALEHMRVVQGGLCGWSRASGNAASIQLNGDRAFQIFYEASGWEPVLLRQRQQERLQRRQLLEAERQREQSAAWVSAFDQERMLLAHIRAGDRNGARRFLNKMLASIYMSAPQTVVLRARVIELVSSLTRAAIEDNPLLESLIEQNHRWVAHMVHADSFEVLSTILMQSLDAFIDAVHLHGANRTNVHVHKALTFISQHYQAELGLQQVAQHAGLSAFRLAHLFREHTGRTVIETIRHVRLQRAEMLLRQSVLTCAEVGYAVGFTDQSYFGLHFKRHTGMTPGQFRRDRAF